MYYLSFSNTELVGGTWTDNVLTQEKGKYLWTRNKVTYTDGAIQYESPICVTSSDDNSYIIILTKETHTVLCDGDGNVIN
jgi:hypothetical protein